SFTVTSKDEATSPRPRVDSYSTDAYRHGSPTRISIPVDLGTASAIDLPMNDEPVAFLSASDGQIAAVYYRGVSGSGKTKYAHFKVRDVSAGTYTGKIDLTPDPTATGGEVSLTLVVRDHWGFAVLTLIGGILLAWLLQYLFGVVLPKKGMKTKIGEI